MAKEIDNRGLLCPQPVLNTKRALEGSGGSLVSIVDNEGAKENILRLVNKLGGWTARAEKKADGIYIHLEEVRQGPVEPENLEEACSCGSGEEGGGPVLMITRAALGGGSEELGNILMRSFVATLKEGPVLPAKMLFLNAGVHLTLAGSPVLDDLRELEQMGVEIFSCGTCLDYYQAKDRLAVGSVTNMFATVENLLAGARCITI